MTRQPVSATPDAVPSPCISVCAMDAAGALCTGCFRTLDEIAAWGMLDADGKRAVLAALPARRAAAVPESASDASRAAGSATAVVLAIPPRRAADADSE